MIYRKKGETHRQYIPRLEAYIESLRENNRALRSVLGGQTEVTNPRTLESYSKEAEELFVTVALIEQQLRNGNSEYAKAFAVGQLMALGFNEVEIATNVCLNDGAYNEKK